MKKDFKQSSLSNYGYDMVVAVSQSSVNKVMKRFMEVHEQKEYLLVLKRVFNEETESYTYEAVDPVLLNIEAKIEMLLNTPAVKAERTPEQTLNIQDLYHKSISYVCKAQLGINEDVADKAPNIIQLNKSDINSKFNATFRPIFKQFELIHLYSEDSYILMQKIEQASDEILEFAYDIKLNYKKDIPFEKLPKQLRTELRENSTTEIPTQYDSLFDIRALYADFTTAMVNQYTPSVENDIELKQIVQLFFDDYVLKDLREKGEDAIFSYSVKPETDMLDKIKKSLVVPAAYKYLVSPYYDENGNESDDKNLYTINYIVMEKDKQFPELKEMEWNWIEKEDRKSGCMAINKENIVKHLQADLCEIIKGAFLEPNVKVSDKFIKIDIDTSYDVVDFPKDLLFEKDKENNYRFVLSYKKDAKDGIHSSANLGIYVGVGITYLLNVSIEFVENNKIQIQICSEGDMEIQTGASHRKGRMTGTEFTCVLSVSTDEKGNLTLNKNTDVKTLDEDISKNFLVDLFTMGTSQKCIDKISSFTDNITKKIKDGISNNLGRIFDNKIHWVLPGNDNFVFCNPILSTGKDLVVDINYKEIK